MLSGTGPWRNVATGETSPEDHAGAWQERWESSGASTVIELPGNQGTGWAGEEQVDCEGMYTDQAGCRGAAGRQAGIDPSTPSRTSQPRTPQPGPVGKGGPR